MGAIGEYDNLYVAVRSDKTEDIIYYYRTFGWEKVNEGRRKINLVDMSFRRPHRIENKDELQLLQVYLETALNTVGRLERMPRPHTLAFILVSAFFSLGLVAAGLCLKFILASHVYAALGWLFVGLGCVCAAAAAVISVLLYFDEGRTNDSRLQEAKTEIAAVCARAKKLIGGADNGQ